MGQTRLSHLRKVRSAAAASLNRDITCGKGRLYSRIRRSESPDFCGWRCCNVYLSRWDAHFCCSDCVWRRRAQGIWLLRTLGYFDISIGRCIGANLIEFLCRARARFRILLLVRSERKWKDVLCEFFHNFKMIFL